LRLVPIVLPGREQRIREPALTELREIGTRVAEAMAPHLTDRYLLFGHSVGAWISGEVARELRRRGCRLPELMIVSAARAPHLPKANESLHLLPDEELLAQLHDRYDGVPAEINEHRELRDLLLPPLRADVQALETYQYYEEPPMPVPIMACGGVEDRAISAADLAAWGKHTSRRFSHRRFPGGHFYVQQSWRDVLQAALRMLPPA
jgi:surfactin synthase thioesterase subunit